MRWLLRVVLDLIKAGHVMSLALRSMRRFLPVDFRRMVRARSFAKHGWWVPLGGSIPHLAKSSSYSDTCEYVESRELAREHPRFRVRKRGRMVSSHLQKRFFYSCQVAAVRHADGDSGSHLLIAVARGDRFLSWVVLQIGVLKNIRR